MGGSAGQGGRDDLDDPGRGAGAGRRRGDRAGAAGGPGGAERGPDGP